MFQAHVASGGQQNVRAMSLSPATSIGLFGYVERSDLATSNRFPLSIAMATGMPSAA